MRWRDGERRGEERRDGGRLGSARTGSSRMLPSMSITVTPSGVSMRLGIDAPAVDGSIAPAHNAHKPMHTSAQHSI